MTRPSERIPNRERAVSSVLTYMSVAGGLLILIGGLALNYGQQQRSPGFIGGFGQGVSVALPFFFVFLSIKAMRLRDEYTRQLQFHTGWIAFTATMLFSGLILAVEATTHLQVPTWAYLAVGLLSFGGANLILSARDRRES